ncbi:hypothetical protein E2C01_026437 [Portunus trituberculatus]|uniref:Uncharacterized protein n=1 Tax=Portunus trituberculatus TaxID=210409 RepID=A0A5B7EI55_PORTR|nr:hypothetical protein [Portunus trituberculatus]
MLTHPQPLARHHANLSLERRMRRVVKTLDDRKSVRKPPVQRRRRVWRHLRRPPFTCPSLPLTLPSPHAWLDEFQELYKASDYLRPSSLAVP